MTNDQSHFARTILQGHSALEVLRSLAGLAILLATVPAIAAEITPDYLMMREPEQPQPWVWTLAPELIPLWKKAMARPESELQRQAAEAIVRARQLGHTGLEATVPELRAILVSPKSHPATRLAAAHALIALDQKSSAASLFEMTQREGKDLRHLVEPALARWKFEPIREVWHHRIANITTPRRDLILAINGLGEEQDVDALDDLLHLALPVEQTGDVRLPAARAAGRIAESGLERPAEQLLSYRPCSTTDRLCAVALLHRHKSNEAVRWLQQLAADPEPTVAADALRALFANDPRLVLPLAEQALQNADANVRKVAIQTYVDQPTLDRIRSLAAALNDPHPELRSLVRNSFFTLSRRPELDAAIRESSIPVLAGSDWRGQEQAALLLGALNQESVAGRLLELLDSPRPEVMVAAAWALKTIAAPETAPAILKFVDRRSNETTGSSRSIDMQMGHLFELLGTMKIKSAEPVLVKYVPKTLKYGEISRSAAVWAMGLIYEGQSNEALGNQLMERLRDVFSAPPELYEVRRTSALSIGRLHGTSQLAGLKELIGEAVNNEGVDLAMRWAVLRISGEALPIEPPRIVERTGWFLEPLPRAKVEKSESGE